MGRFSTFFDSLFGRIHIEKDIVGSDSVHLLHISDTPSSIYPEIKRLIRVLNPDYIVHTGDVSDNIKVGLHPSYITRYKHEAKKMLKILDSSNAEKVFLSLGNHDKLDFVKKNCGRIKVIEDRELITIQGRKFAISHYSDFLKDIDADIYLYGHDLSIESQTIDSRVYLNGISAIHVITIPELDITRLDYPQGTDSERLKRRKTKL
ncbi:metallophosphoesterase [Gudongella sp. SC589]|uniref:metallophosphoesterase n=1 Tax=Gudongella sp. SC589 TaxID=3385990 RepID=UPI0039048F53